MNPLDIVRSEAEPLVETVEIKTHFKTPRGIARAVDGVSIQIRRGQSLGVVGESGSGKTVLSRSIMGLLPRNGVIREGSVRYQGQEIGDRTPKEMRSVWGREMAMIFQDPMTSLNPVMKVGKQITESLRLHLGMSASEAMTIAEKLFRDVRIPEPTRRLNQYPHELSGGMRQRVMIAIAMACGPNMLFADEPTTALDVTVQAQILELISEQKRDRNMSLLLVTHNLGVVAGYTDEIAVMYGGKVVEKPQPRLCLLTRKCRIPKHCCAVSHVLISHRIHDWQPFLVVLQTSFIRPRDVDSHRVAHMCAICVFMKNQNFSRHQHQITRSAVSIQSDHPNTLSVKSNSLARANSFQQET